MMQQMHFLFKEILRNVSLDIILNGFKNTRLRIIVLLLEYLKYDITHHYGFNQIAMDDLLYKHDHTDNTAYSYQQISEVKHPPFISNVFVG